MSSFREHALPLCCSQPLKPAKPPLKEDSGKVAFSPTPCPRLFKRIEIFMTLMAMAYSALAKFFEACALSFAKPPGTPSNHGSPAKT